jgi:hypothetical protein
MGSEVGLAGAKLGSTGKSMRTRLPPPVLVLILFPGLALSKILSRPSLGEVAVTVQPDAPLAEPDGMEPTVTSGVAALDPVGKSNTPVG